MFSATAPSLKSQRINSNKLPASFLRPNKPTVKNFTRRLSLSWTAMSHTMLTCLERVFASCAANGKNQGTLLLLKLWRVCLNLNLRRQGSARNGARLCSIKPRSRSMAAESRVMLTVSPSLTICQKLPPNQSKRRRRLKRCKLNPSKSTSRLTRSMTGTRTRAMCSYPWK